MSGSIYSRFVFPYLCEFFMSGGSLNGFRQDALLKTGGEVLEIGFGTGLNLPHYPDSVKHVDAVDVNPGMSHLARKRIEKSEISVTNYILSGENLPMEDSSYDCVQCTFTSVSYTNLTLPTILLV